MGQAAINFSTLTEELILATAVKEKNCSQEELYFALNCLLRSFHTLLNYQTLDESTKQYAQTQFCSAYKIITGRTVYPF
ncbi:MULTISPECIES: hypothetical protein [unclassified Bacillus (in: firmicutes)]|uniref:hypothetical protein n=1 Tax=Bacillus TaxID=1386 RepID=UPI001574D343|nr:MULTISPECIES: hypothetical protein [unclassified Bacillus (in: firmicutes)]MBC6971568.1 hypothetical protein [Bacillus sp. Xin]MCI0766141.1 hypothetical protein [Bacillus sp. TL12]NSW38297.1 hypothetical protein [Bacillus sp. Xin1]